MKYPKSFNKLKDCFQKYPGVGPKSAERMAFYTVLKLKKQEIEDFQAALMQATSEMTTCSECGLLTDQSRCDVCTDPSRESKIVVVEGTKDAFVLEKTNHYRGKYHVLQGLISPLNGVSPEDINLHNLFKRIERESIEEVIIATPATVEGEMTALYIHNVLAGKDVLVYRIGYGLPAGGELEYADEITLTKALEGRKKM